MNCLSHKYFDGSSDDEERLGDGNFFLLPVELEECLTVMENAKGTKQSYLDVRRRIVYLSGVLSDLPTLDVPRPHVHIRRSPPQQLPTHADAMLGSSAADL